MVVVAVERILVRCLRNSALVKFLEVIFREIAEYVGNPVGFSSAAVSIHFVQFFLYLFFGFLNGFPRGAHVVTVSAVTNLITECVLAARTFSDMRRTALYSEFLFV